jgi:hypothetical protein
MGSHHLEHLGVEDRKLSTAAVGVSVSTSVVTVITVIAAVVVAAAANTTAVIAAAAAAVVVAAAATTTAIIAAAAAAAAAVTTITTATFTATMFPNLVLSTLHPYLSIIHHIFIECFLLRLIFNTSIPLLEVVLTVTLAANGDDASMYHIEVVRTVTDTAIIAPAAAAAAAAAVVVVIVIDTAAGVVVAIAADATILITTAATITVLFHLVTVPLTRHYWIQCTGGKYDLPLLTHHLPLLLYLTLLQRNHLILAILHCLSEVIYILLRF